MDKPELVTKIQDSYLKIRKKKDLPLNFIVYPLYKIGIKPNTVTIFGFICAIISTYFLFKDHRMFIIFYLLNFLSDMIDGTLARMSKIKNPNGQYIDAAADAIFGIALLIKSYFYFKNPLVLIPLFIYVWEAKKIENWASGFYPNITWLKISFLFKLFKFGLIFQFLVSIFNISMRKIYNLKYDPKS